MLKQTLFVGTMLLLLVGCNQYRTVNIIEKESPIIISENIVNIPIHIRDNGYKNFSTKILKNQNDLNQFIKKIKGTSGWNKKKNFFYILAKQEIDFTKNNLIIYRFNEPSNAIVIATEVPTEVNQEITVKIGKKIPSKMTSDMAHYALAYVVSKNTQNLIFDDGEKKQTLNLKETSQK